jgi:protein-S-isoprenylcysteine O-methyltransferase Ste14
LIDHRNLPSLLQINPSFITPPGLVLGIMMTAAGYAGTLWCYVIMGNTWRIGVNLAEKTTLVNQGPYQIVRHPIYLFQIIMLAGATMLLPTALSLITLVVHYLCIWTKASDEESYLLTAHGKEYRDYLSRTGRFLPKLFYKASQSK